MPVRSCRRLGDGIGYRHVDHHGDQEGFRPSDSGRGRLLREDIDDLDGKPSDSAFMITMNELARSGMMAATTTCGSMAGEKLAFLVAEANRRRHAWRYRTSSRRP